MAILKCKMCGGTLEVNNNESVCECEYCGTQQTLPKVYDEVITNLFNRANNLRLKSEFDKASAIYEKIIEQDNNEAEAYWGLVLCKYGIEYVEEPKTFKKIPTCHRASYDSVLTDSDYLEAIRLADMIQKSVYEAEAKVISDIQKNVLSIIEKEEPFDIFICYKETDESGKRTVDSSIANDIYHQLTQEGLKVFYAAITLEDKLGQEYEPYIFAALNSAKVMLVIGTRPEYFEAVWVKNEWSRYIKLMNNDKNKLLIPCYRDMDAYDLPEEFAHLQAQDMSKIGFINDIVRGIQKLNIKQIEQTTLAETVVVNQTNSNTDALLKRAYMFLEDGEWNNADEYCEKVLDIDPENARAYLGKLMAGMHVHKQEELKNCSELFDENNNYKKCIRFADETLANEVTGYITYIKDIKYNLAIARETASKFNKHNISASSEHTVILNSNGSVIATGNNKDGQCNVSDWHDIVAVSAGYVHTVGLKSDGSVVAVGNNWNGRCNVSDWKDIIAVSAGNFYTVGLKSDGSVVAVGDNEDGQCNVSDWEDIIAVAVGYNHTVGLKSDGSAVAVGNNENGQCDVSDWRNIVAVYAGYKHTVGLKSNGSVVAVGYNENGQCNVSDWQYIIAVAVGMIHTVGLKNNGTVVAAGFDAAGVLDVTDWQDIIAVSTRAGHIVGLKSDGSAVAVGNNEDGQCNVSDWHDIVAVSVGYKHTVGLKSDGSVVAVGKNDYGQCNVSYKQVYNSAVKAMTAEAFEEAAKKIDAMNWYKNSAELADKCREKAAECNYKLAVDYMNNATNDTEFEEAAKKFDAINRFQDAAQLADKCREKATQYIAECNYKLAVDYMNNATNDTEFEKAAKKFDAINGFQDAAQLADKCREKATQYIKELAIAQKNALNYSKIISVGYDHIVGLKSDSFVVAIGNDEYRQCKDAWHWGIVAVSAGAYHTVLLSNSGIVFAYGLNTLDYKLWKWRNSVAVSAGDFHTVGLKSDGSLIAAGDNKYGQCNVSNWSNIVAVSAGGFHTVGLKSDGSVIAVGNNECGQCNVSSWRNIVAVYTGYAHTVGLKSNGSVVAVGNNNLGQCDVSDWRDIVAVYTGGNYTVGLKKDGSFVGNISIYGKYISIAIGRSYKNRFIVGLKEDGTVVIEYGKKYNVSKLHDIGPITIEQKRKLQGLCQYCGGKFKGLFPKKCTVCGKKKDYR